MRAQKRAGRSFLIRRQVLSEPLINILMATYNGERFVGEQIESIQRQTYKNWRLLVSDDCSADSTLDVVRRYADADNRINIVSEGVKHGGAKENFFALMRFSDAPYCMFCDQDDVWLPEKVEKSLVALQVLEGQYGLDVPLLVFCDMKVVDENLNVLHESFEKSSHFDPKRLEFRQLLAHNVAAGCCMLFNRILLDICKLSNGEGAEMHDWWAMLASSAFGRIRFIDEALSLYRQHGANEVGANEYSPLVRAKDKEFMVQQFVLSTEQAKAFGVLHGEGLDSCDRRSLQEFIKAGSAASPLAGIVHLAKSGCWKRGARKAGQLFIVAQLSKANRGRDV